MKYTTENLNIFDRITNTKFVASQKIKTKLKLSMFCSILEKK